MNGQVNAVHKDAIKVILFVVIVLGAIVFTACDSGWSVAGYEV